jgi:hypothetical protein
MSAPGTSATWQGTRTKAAFGPGADILALVRVEPVYWFTAQFKAGFANAPPSKCRGTKRQERRRGSNPRQAATCSANHNSQCLQGRHLAGVRCPHKLEELRIPRRLILTDNAILERIPTGVVPPRRDQVYRVLRLAK